MNYLYLCIIHMPQGDIMKIGVGQHPDRRRAEMESQSGYPVTLYKKWEMDGFIGHARENYAIEQQAHAYLENVQFPMWEHAPNMGGKTECFDCSLAKALGAIANAVRWTPTHPRPIKKGYVITHKGFIKNKNYINKYD